MAKKTLTDDLNVALSSITAAAGVIKAAMEEIADRRVHGQLHVAIRKIEVNADIAFDRLRMIKNSVEAI